MRIIKLNDNEDVDFISISIMMKMLGITEYQFYL